MIRMGKKYSGLSAIVIAAALLPACQETEPAPRASIVSTQPDKPSTFEMTMEGSVQLPDALARQAEIKGKVKITARVNAQFQQIQLSPPRCSYNGTFDLRITGVAATQPYANIHTTIEGTSNSDTAGATLDFVGHIFNSIIILDKSLETSSTRPSSN